MDDTNVRDKPAVDRPVLTTADLADVRPPAPERSQEPSSDERTTSKAGRLSSAAKDETAPLFAENEAAGLRTQWDNIQAGFVDEPRRAVEEADGLVASAMTRLAESFATERKRLEVQWDRGSDVTTEDLRLAFRRYRSFFGRLLSV